MKINKLILKNFSSFEGTNIFDFAVDNDGKNIVLIGGQNGAGKTSLFSAIKVALYGPLSFGYVGANTHYTQRIKEFINSKAFQTDNVESGVIINISIKVEREFHDYEISREWYFSKQKLEERYDVKKEGRVLDEQELLYFQNYLQGVIPPSLFEFFLFDGEEVGNIFSTSSYNNYVKNALFTMCDMDLYEIVRKYTSNYISKVSENGSEVDDADYREVEKSVEVLAKSIQVSESRILGLRLEKEKIDIQLQELETAFKNAGGITEKEKKILLKDFAEAEKIKQEMSIQIKSFVEGLMPFFIVKDFADKISAQLDYEEKGEIFYYVQQKINKDAIKTTLKKYQISSEEAIEEIVTTLFDTFRPKGYSENKAPIHDLSKEEIGRVNGMFNALEDFNVDNMLKIIRKKQIAADRTAEINRTLKSAMSDDDANSFAEKENKLLKKNELVTRELFERERKLLEEKETLVRMNYEKNQKYQKLVNSVQNKHVYELSNGISNIMSSLLDKKARSMKTKLEDLIVENLQKIYRKDNLITHIEIEDNFQFNLYQNVTYYEGELLALINNFGYEEVAKLIGQKGVGELLNSYNVKSINELKKVLESSSRMESIETYKRIELGRLSKGERQIFILALYWAMIIISGQDIPFIIDTPYARIDANHRKEISEKFFPNISKQVVILSTDEEINEEFYEIIHPYVAKEYLLTNNEKENRTTIEKKYFFEVKS
ncbi:AAA family ATPase [Lacrimispora sp.]|uniref:AAA family ATPase n=1 Tax=Lacrimispora sp. TaxID=2719234 RepID=UPI0028A99E2A|nr:AAA family ATPase [Lacrimispora sp.]